MKRIRSYSNLVRFTTIEERYEYLRLDQEVGRATFGWDRHINQAFYHSADWKRVRSIVIDRDRGCDLGIEGYELHSDLLIHHMNPILIKDFEEENQDILNPEFLITTSKRTHQAIHYGDKELLPEVPIVRKPGDTRLW